MEEPQRVYVRGSSCLRLCFQMRRLTGGRSVISLMLHSFDVFANTLSIVDVLMLSLILSWVRREVEEHGGEGAEEVHEEVETTETARRDKSPRAKQNELKQMIHPRRSQLARSDAATSKRACN